jgi:hypothetical protein
VGLDVCDLETRIHSRELYNIMFDKEGQKEDRNDPVSLDLFNFQSESQKEEQSDLYE